MKLRCLGCNDVKDFDESIVYGSHSITCNGCGGRRWVNAHEKPNKLKTPRSLLVLCKQCGIEKEVEIHGKLSKRQHTACPGCGCRKWVVPNSLKKAKKKEKTRKQKIHKSSKQSNKSAKDRFLKFISRFSSQKEAYSAYIKTGHWYALRRAKLKINKRCEVCNSDKAIQVHHLKYRHWYDVTENDLCTLCSDCHKDIHNFS